MCSPWGGTITPCPPLNVVLSAFWWCKGWMACGCKLLAWPWGWPGMGGPQGKSGRHASACRAIFGPCVTCASFWLPNPAGPWGICAALTRWVRLCTGLDSMWNQWRWGVTENGMSFENSQEMLSTSVRLYVKGWSLMSLFLMVAKSCNAYEQSSSNSSMEPSGNDPPLNQSQLPWTDGPPCNAIHLATLSCVSLYVCKHVHVMWMKRWSSTQHKIGPMPMKHMMLTPALAMSL